MTACDMCGKDTMLFPALVEGVELNVCQQCASFGKVLKRPVQRPKQFPAKKLQEPKREVLQIIREDYSMIIKEKRERMGLKQMEFAKYLSEKESIIHKIESGTYVPSIDLARKIEKQLGVSLIEEKEVLPQNLKAKSETFTIGDIIKVK